MAVVGVKIAPDAPPALGLVGRCPRDWR